MNKCNSIVDTRIKAFKKYNKKIKQNKKLPIGIYLHQLTYILLLYIRENSYLKGKKTHVHKHSRDLRNNNKI